MGTCDLKQINMHVRMYACMNLEQCYVFISCSMHFFYLPVELGFIGCFQHFMHICHARHYSTPRNVHY